MVPKYIAVVLFILCVAFIHAYEFEPDPDNVDCFGQSIIWEIARALRRLIVLNFIPGTQYNRGNMFWGEVTTTAGTFVIRLGLMSAFGNPMYCQVNPRPGDDVDGLDIIQGFNNLIGACLNDMETTRSASVVAQDGLYLIAYYLEGIEHGYITSSCHQQTVFPTNNKSAFLVPQLANVVPTSQCQIFRGMLQSGYKGMPGSFIVLGESLYSPNSRYSLTVMPDCYVALLYVNPRMELWGSPNTKRYGRLCHLRLQEDGNLVLLDGDDPVWASNVFCTPQPNCVAPSFASLQDDCNFVVYRSPDHVADPQPAWASQTEHCGF